MNYGRLFDPILEANALGAAMRDQGFLQDLLELQDSHFVDHQTKVALQAIRELDAEGSATGVVEVRNRLVSNGQFDKVGGIQFLNQCLSLDYISLNDPGRLLASLKAYEAKRSLAKALQAATEALAESPVEMTENVVADLGAALSGRLASEAATAFAADQLGAMVFDAAREASLGRGGADIVKTGIDPFDNLVGGIKQQELVIIAARPSHGKTAFAGTIALNAAVAGRRVAFFSIEVQSGRIGTSLVSKLCGIDTRRIEKGALTESEWGLFRDASDNFRQLDLTVDEQVRIKASTIRARVKRMSATKPVDLVVVDYLQLIQGDKADNREQQVAHICREMKLISRELKTRVVLLAQLNRLVEGRETRLPQTSDIRESGAAEQDADHVWLLHYPPRATPSDTTIPKNLIKVIVGKNRHGPGGMLELGFNPATQRIMEKPFTMSRNGTPQVTHFRRGGEDSLNDDGE